MKENESDNNGNSIMRIPIKLVEIQERDEKDMAVIEVKNIRPYILFVSNTEFELYESFDLPDDSESCFALIHTKRKEESLNKGKIKKIYLFEKEHKGKCGSNEYVREFLYCKCRCIPYEKGYASYPVPGISAETSRKVIEETKSVNDCIRERASKDKIKTCTNRIRTEERMLGDLRMSLSVLPPFEKTETSFAPCGGESGKPLTMRVYPYEFGLKEFRRALYSASRSNENLNQKDH